MLEIQYQGTVGGVQETVVAGPHCGSQEVEVLGNLGAGMHLAMYGQFQIYYPDVVQESRQRQSELSRWRIFCGPGGFSEGAKQACYSLGFGFQSRIACDFSISALSIYCQNHRPSLHRVENLANIFESVIYKTVDGLEILDVDAMEFRTPFPDAEDIDLFLAGPPCEGNSRLNNHTRGDDVRNELYLFAIAIAIKLKAKAISIENVASVGSSRQNVVERALKMLEVHEYSYKKNTPCLPRRFPRPSI